MNRARIKQHHKTLQVWPVGRSGRVTDKLKKDADIRSVVLRQQGHMKNGYYDLEVIDGCGTVLDSEILIA